MFFWCLHCRLPQPCVSLLSDCEVLCIFQRGITIAFQERCFVCLLFVFAFPWPVFWPLFPKVSGFQCPGVSPAPGGCLLLATREVFVSVSPLTNYLYELTWYNRVTWLLRLWPVKQIIFVWICRQKYIELVTFEQSSYLSITALIFGAWINVGCRCNYSSWIP